MPDQFSAAAKLLRDGVAQRAYPAACIEVGRHSGPLWQQAFGTLTYDNDAAPATLDTVFDLASLTKVIATTSLAMRAVDEGRLRVDDPIGRWLQEWRGKDRDHVTVRDLLAHCAGLSGYLPFFRDHTGRPEIGEGQDGVTRKHALRLSAAQRNIPARLAPNRPRIGHAPLESLGEKMGRYLLELPPAWLSPRDNASPPVPAGSATRSPALPRSEPPASLARSSSAKKARAEASDESYAVGLNR